MPYEAFSTLQPTTELLYSDHEGGQRTISLFSVTPRDVPDDPEQWLCSVARHWSIDRPDPR